MTETSITASSQSELPSVRARIVTKDGQIVDTTTDVWVLRTSPDGGSVLRFDWRAFRQTNGQAALDERSTKILQLFAAWKLATKKAHTTRNTLSAVRRLQHWYPHFAVQVGRDVTQVSWAVLDDSVMDAFLAHGLTTAERGNDFSRLRDLYRWGAFGLELPDFDPRLAVALEARRAPGNVKGASVRGHHPTDGPLSSDEQALVIDAIKRGVGSDQDRAIVMLHFELGMNPSGAARAWNSGLVVYEADLVEPGGTPNHEMAYHLAVPRVKKRTEQRQTRNRPLSPELGALLVRLRDGGPDGRLLHWLNDQQPVLSIHYAINRWARAADLYSPRTGKPLQLNARRFRYTLATEMAREGASRHKIADVLDHTDLQNVEVYIEASSYIVTQVGDRFDPRFQPVLQRFLGKVVDTSDPQPFPGLKRKVIPGVVVQLPMVPVKLGGIGACGKDAAKEGICQLAPPLSCYGCDKFAAFRDFDHGSIGDALERVITTRFDGQADERIPLQLVGTVHAIRQVEHQIADERSLAASAP